MENASKALIMAGSVLISLLVIGALTFMYNQLSGVEQTKVDAEEVSKMIEYGKQFEQYNKNVYGSELLSLANLKLNYNLIQAEMKTYEPIKIMVRINENIEEDGTLYISQGNLEIETIRNGISSLENAIKVYEKPEKKGYEDKDSIKRSVKYYAQLNYRQIATLFEVEFLSDEPDDKIVEKLTDESQNKKTSKLLEDIEKYKNLKTLLTSFKRKQFENTRCKIWRYRKNNRNEF